MRTALLFTALSALALASCTGIQVARMAVPDTLAANAVTIPITGIGGGSSGTFQAGELSGRFSRSDTRLAVFDPLVERRGGTLRFSLRGPGLQDELEGDCRARERTMTLGVVTYTQPMSFLCEFRSAGRPLAAELQLHVQREGFAGTREHRRGEIEMDGTVLQIRSIHDVEGSGIRLATPIGYVFEHDGAAVGAVEINGSPVIRHDPEAAPSVRLALTVAAIALGLFWDPGESALGREAG